MHPGACMPGARAVQTQALIHNTLFFQKETVDAIGQWLAGGTWMLVGRRTRWVPATVRGRRTTRPSFGNVVPSSATCRGRKENLNETWTRIKNRHLALHARRLAKSPVLRGQKASGALGLAPQEPVVLAVLPDAVVDQGDVGHNAMSDGCRNRPTVTIAVSSN